MNIRGELAAVTRRINILKQQRSEKEGQLGALNQQRDSIYEDCRKMSVEPENLGDVIAKSEEELSTILGTIKSEVDTIERQFNSVVAQRSTVPRTSS